MGCAHPHLVMKTRGARMTLSKKKPGKTATAARGGRYHTSRGIQTLVWIRAAGHCELCGACLTEDLRTGRRMRWGEVAHIMPASAKGPRSEAGHTEAAAAAPKSERREI